MTHHPHLHMIVPGGGLSLDGKKWLACRPGFFLPVRVLVPQKLADAHAAGRLAFFGDIPHSPTPQHSPFAFCPGPHNSL
jgi:Putative transposase